METETTAVQLDIYTNWWLWRGSLRDYWPAWTDNPLSEVPLGYPPWDPIDYDGPKYNEALAFPATKPNYDVFGIPRRTRKQRGWYQVRVPGRVLPSTSSHDASVSVAAADLPAKVIENVMETIARGAERTELASCSLVSRYWYQRMVPRLFGHLQLTSRRRAVGLRDITLSPSHQFLRHIKPRIELSVGNVLELNWVHLVAHIPCNIMEMSLTGPVPPSELRPPLRLRSVHHALPRSVPSSWSRSISGLNLRVVHFPRFSDLTHLVCELPGLRALYLTDVTWGSPPRLPTARPRRRISAGRQRLVKMSFLRGNLDWAHASVCMFAQYLSSSKLFFASNDDMRGLCSLLQSPIFQKGEEIAEVYYEGEDKRAGSFTIKFIPRQGIHITIRVANLAQPDGSPGPSRIACIAITAGSGWVHHDLDWRNAAIDWPDLDDRLCALDPPAAVVFAFQSRETMLEFAAGVVDAGMPRASARGLVKYAISGGNFVDWRKAWRDKEGVAEEAFFGELVDLYA